MESEIQRRKEHTNFATKFENARGFVRTNWKSKNFDPNKDPTAEDSSTDESDIENIEKNDVCENMSNDSISSPMKKRN